MSAQARSNITNGVCTGNPVAASQTSAMVVGNRYGCINSPVLETGVQCSLTTDFREVQCASGLMASPYSISVTGLVPGKVYCCRAFVRTRWGICYGNVRKLAMPKVLTGTTANLTTTSVTIQGNTYCNVEDDVKQVAIQYDTTPSFISSQYAQGTIASPYSVNIAGLTSGTVYYFRAAITTSAGFTYYGEIKRFETTTSVALATKSTNAPQIKQAVEHVTKATATELAPAVKAAPAEHTSATPQVTTGLAIDITQTGAIIDKNAYSNMSNEVTRVAVEYSSTDDFRLYQGTIGPLGDQTFAVKLVGLVPNTKYYYKAIVTSHDVAYNGKTDTFTTKPLDMGGLIAVN